MVIIDAVGKDGRPILDDLQHSSPTGGLCQTATRPRAEIQPGHLVRDSCGWSVVLGTATDGVLGITTLALMRADLTTRRATLYTSDCAEVRTDATIDTWSLWKLADLAKRGAVSLVKSAA